MPNEKISKPFYTAALKNDWEKAETHLLSYTTAQWYKDRLTKEIKLLREERKSKY